MERRPVAQQPEQQDPEHRTPGGPARPTTLAALPAELAHLSPAMRRIAGTVLDDPAAATVAPAADLAHRSGTSTATVSRFARLLGHPSFAALQHALVQEQAVAATRREPTLSAHVDLHDDPATVVDKVLQDLVRIARGTREALDPSALARAGDRLVGARRVLLFGVGASGLVAQDLGHKLERLGLPVWTADERHRGLTLASTLGPEDVVLCVSHGGATQETVAVARHAREHGAGVIALTGRPGGALAATAEIALISVGGTESALRPAATGSRLSQLAIVDALFAVIAQRTYRRSGPLIADSWSALRHTHEE
ncbi:MAG TPA: MurR/RpiR family transcriptional regulator [Cellulomonas sp.]